MTNSSETPADLKELANSLDHYALSGAFDDDSFDQMVGLIKERAVSDPTDSLEVTGAESRAMNFSGWVETLRKTLGAHSWPEHDAWHESYNITGLQRINRVITNLLDLRVVAATALVTEIDDTLPLLETHWQEMGNGIYGLMQDNLRDLVPDEVEERESIEEDMQVLDGLRITVIPSLQEREDARMKWLRMKSRSSSQLELFPVIDCY